jgi:hypothetical protein
MFTRINWYPTMPELARSGVGTSAASSGASRVLARQRHELADDREQAVGETDGDVQARLATAPRHS